LAELTASRCLALVEPHLEAGEQPLYLGHGIDSPWWTRFSGLTTLLWRHYVLAATDRRLLLVEQGLAQNEKSFASLSWTELERVSLGRGLLVRPLDLEAPARGFQCRLQMPRLSVVGGAVDNWATAEGVLAIWSERRRASATAATG
jgi:hypothetical protein